MERFNKNFILMVIGQIISIFGSSVLRFALSLYVLDTTGRADIFAVLLAVSTLPVIVLSPIGGAIADRWNRRNLMVIFDFASSVILILFALQLWLGDVSIVFIGVVMTLLSVISTMYQPAVQASIPLLVREESLVKANGIVTGVGSLSSLAAPVLGGVLYSFFGLKTVVEVSCIAFFCSAVMEMFIHIPFTRQERSGHIVSTIVGDMKKGTVYVVKQNPFIFKIMILAAGLNLFLTPFFIVGVPYILKVTMSSSDTMFGISTGVLELSTILGALAVGMVAKRLKIGTMHVWMIMIGLLILPMAVSVYPLLLNLGYWPSYLLFILCAGLITIAMTILSIYVISIVQKETPNELLGKVMSIIFATAQCAAPVGQILYGALFHAFHISVYVPILLVSVVTFMMAFAAKVVLRNDTELRETHTS
ncbi:MFS transporter [Brevibacillus ruminantium]|uniref:MFS transporter n=1 Tax=Brevibacillus ruminantium TaxID=2950604 RepID=A0ABY4WDG7_9BACL|nr:MFS transporter [Brevibacillus ruminantium]USG64799.1 MFS transporter [Brevibacillus ruminantium]